MAVRIAKPRLPDARAADPRQTLGAHIIRATTGATVENADVLSAGGATLRTRAQSRDRITAQPTRLP